MRSAGTFAVISVFETTLKVAVVPLKSTAVVPVRLFPRITMSTPALPVEGKVLTNGASPVIEFEGQAAAIALQPFGGFAEP